MKSAKLHFKDHQRMERAEPHFSDHLQVSSAVMSGHTLLFSGKQEENELIL
jgi:hypothetical protein